LDGHEAAATRARTGAILAASYPGDAHDPATWATWARLMPHLLAADLAATDNPRLRSVACSASLYLVARGDAHASRDLANRLYPHWRQRLGADDPHTLRIATYLASALQNLGDYGAARDLDQDTLDRSRRLLGDDHRNTLTSATNLAIDLRALGEVRAAR